MRFLNMFIIFTILILFGCQDNTIIDPEPLPIETEQLEKTDPNAGGAFPYLQEFLYITQIEYSINGTDIIVEIKNRNIFNRGNHFFAVINYTQYNLMVYLNKPQDMKFIIPYLGDTEITSIQLYCIMEYE